MKPPFLHRKTKTPLSKNEIPFQEAIAKKIKISKTIINMCFTCETALAVSLQNTSSQLEHSYFQKKSEIVNIFYYFSLHAMV